MTFKTLKWLKALLPTRRLSRVHPICSEETDVRTFFIAMDSFDMETDDDLVPVPSETNERAEECSICLEDYFETSNHRRVVRLLCSHSFHEVCISTWFGMKVNCPLCRRHKLVPHLPLIQ